MGFRFRKSVKIGKHAKINFNKNSVGFTVGTKGAHFTANSKGRKTTTVGVPGTGLSYSHTSGGKKKKQQAQEAYPTLADAQEELKRDNPAKYDSQKSIAYFITAIIFALGAFALTMFPTIRIISGIASVGSLALAWFFHAAYKERLRQNPELAPTVLLPGVSYGNPSKYKKNSICFLVAAVLFALSAFIVSNIIARIILVLLVIICLSSARSAHKIYKALQERDKEWSQPSPTPAAASTSDTASASFRFPATDKNGKPALQLITLEIHGVNHEHDGTDPQTVLPTLSNHEQVLLVPDKDNEHDPYAVRVFTTDMRQIGWLPAGTKDVFERLIEDREVYARIKRVYERSWYDDKTITSADIEIARYKR